MTKVIRIVMLFAVMLSLSGCGEEKPYKETQFLMDTVVEITAYGPNAQSAVKEAFSEFKRIDQISNRYNPESEISRINQSAGKDKMTVSAELIDIIAQSIISSRESSGSFDITIGALTELWGVGHKDEYVPSDEEIKIAQSLVGYEMLQVNPAVRSIFLPRAGMLLDVGGIAKHYAMDKAISALKARGVQSALLNAGGDISVIGTRPDGQPWRIGVQHPRKNDSLIAKATLSNWNTVETSGDYQRYFIKNGVRYSHILDPKTGKQPTEIASISIFSTGRVPVRSSGFYVLGVEQGLKLLQKYPGTEAIIVTRTGQVIVTPGLKTQVELME